MSDPRYEYQRVNVIKVIVQNPQGQVLLIQEPETNEWMPLHWGLPGGKPLEKESLLEAFDRKMKEELGQRVPLSGLVRLEELLIEGRTVLMFIGLVKLDQTLNPAGESKSYRWASREEVEAMDSSEFTEFYNKSLLQDFFAGSYILTPTAFIESLKFFEMSEDPPYKRWFESGKKK